MRIANKNKKPSSPNSQLSISDSIVPILICLLIERGLSMDIIKEGPGMFAHVLNIIVLVLIPMVIIHVNGDGFSLSKLAIKTPAGT